MCCLKSIKNIAWLLILITSGNPAFAACTEFLATSISRGVVFSAENNPPESDCIRLTIENRDPTSNFMVSAVGNLEVGLKGKNSFELEMKSMDGTWNQANAKVCAVWRDRFDFSVNPANSLSCFVKIPKATRRPGQPPNITPSFTHIQLKFETTAPRDKPPKLRIFALIRNTTGFVDLAPGP